MMIQDFLSDPASWEYQSEWGSPLEFDSFQPIDNHESYFASFNLNFAFREKDVSAKLHILHRDASEKWFGKLEIEGKSQIWQDPHSYLIGAEITEIENWVAWIFSVDAESRRDRALQTYENSQQWGTDSVEGMLARVDLGITTYGRLSTNSANFTDAQSFTNWLNENSPSTHAEFTVYALEKPEEYCQLPWQTRPFIIHRGSIEQPEPKILYSVARAEPTCENGVGMASVSQGWVMSSAISFALDGTQIAAHDCLDVLDLSFLQPFISKTGAAAWYILTVKGLEIGILCPAAGACIDLDWDHDGTSISLTVTDEDRVVVDNIATARHRKKWNKWYNESVEITDAELAKGIVEAETAFFQLMAEEDAVLAKEAEDE
ncbi:hypothetical protein HMPREF0044_1413 [Gleimia coleocanis DSM 15436]|uniref:Uncharacterized protein n=1 Tax=Gleimia coleocanis DSM 15436 TaxID=525245 RepID=C0W1X3_9ACTO|nr:hypothetical protein [Gleimia coleocanis]EEH63489.1 hypothetical protein HMPREF0044_1413 [Gleimia coleocanis DSM 15436]